MVKTPAVQEYQVHQAEGGIHVEMVVDGVIGEPALVASLTASLRAAGLPTLR